MVIGKTLGREPIWSYEERVSSTPFLAGLASAIVVIGLVALSTKASRQLLFYLRFDRAAGEISGTWSHNTPGVGKSIWTISKNSNGSYTAVESWLGGAVGRATLDGKLLSIRAATSSGDYIVVYSWMLNEGLTSGTGKLTFVRMPQPNSRLTEYVSTVVRVPPAFWHRSWFLVLAALALSGVLYSAYRYRLDNLMQLERVRTRVASDLHDDIGSNLSLIAGMSEILQQRTIASDPQMAANLTVIAQVARRSVDAMSDIVWAVNPRRDNLPDLVHRMRRFASDVFGTQNVRFNFQTPSPDKHIPVGPEVRRQVFLVFKEAVNNAARHSACSKVDAMLQVARGKIVLELRDDGLGFDETTISAGHGLESMRLRAEKMGGELLLSSGSNSGTTVTLKVPLDGHS